MINNPILGPNLQAMNGVSFIQKAIPVSILVALTVGVIIFFFNLLMGGIAYINSGGDKGKTEAARSKITNAIIGIVVMFAIYVTIAIVGVILGIDLFVLDLETLQIK